MDNSSNKPTGTDSSKVIKTILLSALLSIVSPIVLSFLLLLLTAVLEPILISLRGDFLTFLMLFMLFIFPILLPAIIVFLVIRHYWPKTDKTMQQKSQKNTKILTAFLAFIITAILTFLCGSILIGFLLSGPLSV